MNSLCNSILTVTFFLMANHFCTAQCTPDQYFLNAPAGIYPETSANCGFTFTTFTDTFVTGIPIVGELTLHIDNFRLESITGLPLGLNISTDVEGSATANAPYGTWLNTGNPPGQSNIVGCISIEEGSASFSSLVNGGPNNDGIYPLTFLIDGRIGLTVPDASIIIPNGTWLSTVDTSIGGGVMQFEAILDVNECGCNVSVSESYEICNSSGVNVGSFTYTDQGTYTQTLAGSGGCDTILVANVTEVWPYDLEIFGDDMVDPNVDEWYTISNVATDSTNWSVSNGTAIITFLDTIQINWNSGAGYVAIEAWADGCSNTDTLFINAVTGLKEHDQTALKIYPNPSSGLFEVISVESGNLEVLDARGKTLMAEVINKRATIDLVNFSTGIYIARFSTPKATSTKRLVKH